MPGLPSQQKAALAYTLARRPTSSSDMMDEKWSPHAESKRLRRGAKQHQSAQEHGSAHHGRAQGSHLRRGGGGTAPAPADGSRFRPDVCDISSMDNKETIIKGVAPSGSGKTKQRRDREAAEKTRRLSEAVAAGLQGDLRRLAEVHHLPQLRIRWGLSRTRRLWVCISIRHD